MEIKDMTVEELEARKADIRNELEADGADLDALETEVRSINEELENRKAAEAQRAEIRKAVAMGEGETVKEIKTEERKTLTLEEVRSSKEYINAYANYIKTEDDSECRALLTEIVAPGEGLPVPAIIEGRIRTAWERAQLLGLTRKTYLKGVIGIGFELSATGAAVHEEGDMDNLPDEEELTIGKVTLVPQSLKKWITISDEAVDMGGEEFLDYIFDEITYRIAKLAEDTLVGLVAAAGTTATATAVSVSELVDDGTDILSIIPSAVAHLSDEAANPVIVMNKLTYAAFKAAQLAANYAVDPFDGLPVYFNSTLVALENATDDDCWLVVGDFGVGAHANFPNGDEIRIKYDDLSLAEKDLVKIVGREYVALGLVADKAFTRVVYGTGE